MSGMLDGYRSAREAQDERFNTREGHGGIDISCTDTEEYRQYFGQGEWAGGGVEPRITYKAYLKGMADPRRHETDPDPAPAEPADDPRWITRKAAFYLPGDVLLEAAGYGDPVAAAELLRRRERRAEKRAARQAVAS